MRILKKIILIMAFAFLINIFIFGNIYVYKTSDHTLTGNNVAMIEIKEIYDETKVSVVGKEMISFDKDKVRNAADKVKRILKNLFFSLNFK